MRSGGQMMVLPPSTSFPHSKSYPLDKGTSSFCGDAEVFLDRMLEQCQKRPKARHPGFGRELVPYFSNDEATSPQAKPERSGFPSNKSRHGSASPNKMNRSPRSPLSSRGSGSSRHSGRRSGSPRDSLAESWPSNSSTSSSGSSNSKRRGQQGSRGSNRQDDRSPGYSRRRQQNGSRQQQQQQQNVNHSHHHHQDGSGRRDGPNKSAFSPTTSTTTATTSGTGGGVFSKFSFKDPQAGNLDFSRTNAGRSCREEARMNRSGSMCSLFAGPGCFQSPPPEAVPMPTAVLLAKAICSCP